MRRHFFFFGLFPLEQQLGAEHLILIEEIGYSAGELFYQNFQSLLVKSLRFV
jgi:hypothetical protein